MFYGNILFYTIQFEYRTLSIDFHYIRQACEWKWLQHGFDTKIESL